MTKIQHNTKFNESIVDLFVAGTPCQSFSLAGLRAGLDSANGNLALQYCKLLIAKKPRWFVWENVPGVFSSFSNETAGPDIQGEGFKNGADITETSDFATLLTAFSECGYSCSYRVFDSQYFGVPQRRRRVFVIGYLGDDWRPSAAVLFEQKSSGGNFTPGKKKKQGVAGTVNAGAARSRGAGIDPGMTTVGTMNARTKGGGFPGTDESCDGYVIPVANTIGAGVRKSDRGENENLIVGSFWDGSQTSQTLDAVLHKGQMMPEKNRFPCVLQGYTIHGTDGTVNVATDSDILVGNHKMVRRLTPLECERLQGFPDNYTNIPGASDSARYKALGNSMTTNVMAYLGKRIDMVDKVLKGEL